MKQKKLTITGRTDDDICGYLMTIGRQISEGFTSGQSGDGEVYWDLSNDEA